jgi:C1A family cysteine protease
MIYNLVVAFAVLAVASARNVHDRAFYEEKFFEWMQEYKVEAGSGNSFVKMLQNFADNHDIIEEHNAGNHTWTMGLNQFSHMSKQEWVDFISKSGIYTPELRSIGPDTVLEAPEDLSTLASSVDWVSSGLVTSVKNQGNCGSCWSFSATGALEGAWRKAGKALTDFSPQEFVDCDTKDHACNGKFLIFSLFFC